MVDTGARTEIGKINQGVQEAKQETTKTPLAQKLDEFGNQLTYIIGIICLAVWGFSYPEFSNPVHGSFFKGALYYAKVAVALGVRHTQPSTRYPPHATLITALCFSALVLIGCLGVCAPCVRAARWLPSLRASLPSSPSASLSVRTLQSRGPGLGLMSRLSLYAHTNLRSWSPG